MRGVLYLHPGIAVVVGWLVCGVLHGGNGDFLRGDGNMDGVIDISDAADFPALHWLLQGGPQPSCFEASDSNNDDFLSPSDGAFLFVYLFTGTQPPCLPFPTPGPDPDTNDTLDCVSYSVAPPSALADFTLGFECPTQVVVPPSEAQFDVFATLTTENNSTSPLLGAEGWSISIGVENLRVVSVSVGGTVLEAGLFPFTESSVVNPSLDIGSGPQGEGAVSSVIGLPIDFTYTRLDPTGTARILTITLEATAPVGGNGMARIFYTDGKQGNGLPVPNVISLLGTSHQPTMNDCEISLVGTQMETCDDNVDNDLDGDTDCDDSDCAAAMNCLTVSIKPGDANQDGTLDGADPVALLSWFFSGVDFPAPPGAELCLATPGETDVITPVGLQVLDWSNDGTLDLSDGVGQLAWTFTGGTEHPDCIPTVLVPPNCPNCIEVVSPECIDTCTPD